MLLTRHYRLRVIEAAFQRLGDMSREEALRKVERKPSEKMTMVVTYDPRLPNMSAVLQKHFKTLTSDQHMKEVFGKGMQVAHKRYRNIREFVCRAKLYEKQE